MAVINEVNTGGRARLDFSKQRDIDEFVDMLGKYERGEIAPEDWRRFRLLRGTYGQRQDDVQMLRIKIPQALSPARSCVRWATWRCSRCGPARGWYAPVRGQARSRAVFGFASCACMTALKPCSNCARGLTPEAKGLPQLLRATPQYAIEQDGSLTAIA